MRWHSQPGEKGKGKLGRKPGQKEKEKGKRIRRKPGFGSNKRGSGESRGQKRANQRCNRRFFGVLPETRSTGETTRTKTDAQSILRDLGLWKRKKQTKEIGGNTRWKTTNKQKGKERRKLLKSSCRTVSCHARRVRRVRREKRGKGKGGVIS